LRRPVVITRNCTNTKTTTTTNVQYGGAAHQTAAAAFVVPSNRLGAKYTRRGLTDMRAVFEVSGLDHP